MLDTNKFKILLIDDSETDYFLTKEYLKSQNEYDFDLEWERNFEAGLEKIVDTNFDACLLDYNIGSDSGLELAKAARSKGCRQPIILFSGLDEKAIKQLIEGNTEIEGFLSKKDFSGERLVQEMQGAFFNRQLADHTAQDIELIAEKIDETQISQFILENFPDPIMALDENADLALVNRAMTELMELSADELLGVNASVFLNCSKEDLLSDIKKGNFSRKYRNPIKSKSNEKTYIMWDFVHPKDMKIEKISAIARGSIGKKYKKRNQGLKKFVNLIPKIFLNPSYCRSNNLFFRKDLF